MSKITIPIIFLVLVCSLIYCWFWNCYRRPYCDQEAYLPTVDVKSETEPIAEPMTEVEQEELLFKPLEVYFETGDENISRNSEIDLFIETAKKYLAAHPDKKLRVVGHTDNTGSDATNDPLSIIRAQKMQEFLVIHGLSIGQMVVSGKGEHEPIASNETPEGRAKNRRVTINLAE